MCPLLSFLTATGSEKHPAGQTGTPYCVALHCSPLLLQDPEGAAPTHQKCKKCLPLLLENLGGKFTPRFLNAFAGYKVSVRRVQRAALSSGR